ncbi:PPE family protein [Mycolicibacillus trivialis]
MFVDFGSRPPEVNATLIYGGDRSVTMQAAAAAWDGLAANLQAAAASYKAAVSKLVNDEWLGPSSAMMAAKLMPYTAWMDSTAGRAEQSAVQARAAAAAFDTAFAATVPPPVIAANRAQLGELVAANVLGVNTAAIMATEALYAEMWAQCAAAMYGYAGAASTATRLAPFSGPQHKPDPAAQSAEDAAVSRAGANSGQGQVQQTVSGMLNQLTAPGEAGGGNFFDNFWGAGDVSGIGPNANIWNTITSSGATNPAVPTAMMGDAAMVITALQGSQGLGAGGLPGGPGIGSVMGGTSLVGATTPVTSAAGLAGGTAPTGAGSVTAGMGRATPVGLLSTPASWGAAAPTGPTTSLLPGHSPAAAAHAGGPGAPGVPLAGLARGVNGSGPRYGIRPTVMARPPAAGYTPDLF